MSGVGRERIDAFTVLLLLAFVTVALAGVWKGLQLFVSRERRPATLRRGLFPLFIVGMVAPILGVLGGAMSLYQIGSLAAKDGLMLDAATLAGDIASAGLQLSLGILIAITAGTLWFVLVLRVASIEQSECAGLLGYPG